MARNRRRKKKSHMNDDIMDRHKSSVDLKKLSEREDQDTTNEDWDEDEDLNFFLPDNLNLSMQQLALNSPEENEEIVEKIYGKEFLDNIKRMASGDESNSTTE